MHHSSAGKIMFGVAVLAAAGLAHAQSSGLPPVSLPAAPAAAVPAPPAAHITRAMHPVPKKIAPVPQAAVVAVPKPPGAPPLPAAAGIAPPKASVSVPDKYHSLLFSGPDMERISNASHAYQANLERMRQPVVPQGPALPGAVAGYMPQTMQPAKPQTVDHPQYYLAMVAYRSPSEWSVRLNDHEYNSLMPAFGELHVVSVNRTSARFQWRPKMFPIYEDRMPADAANPRIAVHKNDQTIEFTLYPNQSFSSYSMTIEEGYLPPVRVEQLDASAAVHINMDGKPIKEASAVPSAAPSALPVLPSTGIYDLPNKEDIARMAVGIKR